MISTVRFVGILLVLASGMAVMAQTAGVENLRDASAPAWSVHSPRDEMVVAVSPVRQAIQLVSSSALLLGAGIDAVVNDKYAKAVRQALGDYDAGKVFEDRLAKRLAEKIPNGVARVAPLGSSAGYNSDREAEAARFTALAKAGHDALLDLKTTYGIFGVDGWLVAKIEGRLVRPADKHRLWAGTILVSADPVLANTRLIDPTKRMGSSIAHARLTVKEGAVDRWVKDGGATIRARYEAAVDGAVSALLCELGLAEEAQGEYYLGLASMNRKRFMEAEGHFRKAVALEPAWPELRNARAVNMAHHKQLDDAIAQCRDLTKDNAGFGPAWFNLAWWYATGKNDLSAARPCYEKALQLGMASDPKLDRILGK